MKGTFTKTIAAGVAAIATLAGLAFGAGAATAAPAEPAEGSIQLTGSEAQLNGRQFDVYKIAGYNTDANKAITGVTTDATNKAAVDAAVKATVTDKGFFDGIGDADVLDYAINQGKLEANSAAARTLADKLEAATAADAKPALTKVSKDEPTFTIDAEAAKAGAYTYTPADPGLYLLKDVTATAGVHASTSLAILIGTKTANDQFGAGTIAIKNAAANKPNKTITNGATNGSVAKGDTLTYQITYTATKDAPTSFVFADTPSTGLTIPADTTLTVTDQTDNKVVFTAGDDYTVKTVVNGKDAELPLTGNGTDQLTVTFTEAGLKKIKANDVIALSYTAKVNDAATTDPITNTVTVTDNGVVSEGDTVRVQEGSFTFKKVGVAQADVDGLAGATFGLYASAVDANANNGKGQNAIATATSGNDGTVKFDGLKAGTYYVKETATPNGYLAAYQPGFKVTLAAAQTDKNGNVTFTATFAKDNALADYGLAKDVNGTWTVTNIQRKDQLPNTGAAGIALLVVVGALLIGGGSLIVLKSRKGLARIA
ncbi:collagen-binding protein [Bifidobacterium margollesii]|uniref:Collagen-binding protein n=1 Tax=Bifidobacterium margollesii TaxID=2020964 RepID=A0A2N5JC97_9BIFI|nr:SpaH/EbpB family LPXTG-anchored major pilin [Bifidobacterium margollesii]PLS31843.1 collagen-binding protein [Bifidobacterium margollesii]